MSGSPSYPFTVISAPAITTNGSPVQVIVTGDANPISSSGWCLMRLFRGSTAIGQVVQAESTTANVNVPYCIQFVDAVAAGTYTYSMKVVSGSGAFNFGEATGPVITVTELQNVIGATGYTGSGGTGFTGSQGAGYTGSKGETGATPNTPPVTGSAYQASSSISVPNSTPVTVVTFTLPSAGTWDVGYWMRAQTTAGNGFAGEAALYDSTGTLVPNSEVLAFYDNAIGVTTNKSGTGSARTIITTTGSATYTMRAFASTGSFFALSDGNGRNGVVWVQLTGGYIGYTGSTGATGYVGSAGVLTGAIPAWTSAGAITITATTTNPTKGATRTQDNISYRQIGAKEWEVVLTYIQTALTGGASGSGDYLITLPNSLSFDTTLPSQQIYTGGVGASVWSHLPYVIPNCNGTITNNTVGGQIFPMVYNATKFRILTMTYGTGIQCWGSGFYSIGGDNPRIQLTFRFTST
jgi:hypothetical protein